MHLVSNNEKSNLPSFYLKNTKIARSNSLGFLFYKLRQNKNLSKRGLAEHLGFKEAYLSAIEAGLFPSLKFCLKCAVLFDVNPEYVKNRWAMEAIERFTSRIKGRMGLDV